MNRITWTELPHGGSVGEVTIGRDTIKIASISFSIKRHDPKPWVLRMEIPGWKNARHHGTTDAARESAERILTSFVTAMRPAPPTMSEVRQAAENAHESGYPNAAFGDFLHGFQCAANWLTRGRG